MLPKLPLQLRQLQMPRLVARHLPTPGSRPELSSDEQDENAEPIRATLLRFGPDTLQTMAWSPDNKFAPPPPEGPPFLWIDSVGLDDIAGLKTLATELGLHQLLLEDVAHTPQRAKTEDYGDLLFIVAKMPSADRRLEQISLVLSNSWVASFQEREGDCFEHIRRRLDSPDSRIRKEGPDYLAYAIIDAVVDSYFPIVQRLGDEIDALEQQLIAGTRVPPAAILGLRRELIILKREVAPMREAIHALLAPDLPHIDNNIHPFIRDCEDHTRQLLDDIEGCLQMVAALSELQLTQTNQRLNEVMKVLTIVSTLFIPLGFIAGLYGMNFDPSVSPYNMPELRSPYGYPLAIAAMIAVSGGMLGFFWYKGWLRSDPS